MTIQYALDILNDNKKIDDDYKKSLHQKRDVYYCMSLHTTGATPRFVPLGNRQTYYTPKSYFGPEYQQIFINRLLSRHPREGEETFQWRLSQYKPITRTPFLQIIELASSSIFQDNNYSIEISDENEEKYIKSAAFDNLSLVEWIRQIAFQSIMEDPNGYILRIPSKPYNEQTKDKIEMSLWFVKSIEIIYNDDVSLLFKRDGVVYLVTTEDIFTIEKDDNQEYATIVGYYHHGLGRLPTTIAGGIWNTQGFWDSFLVKAQAVADEYVSSYSSEQLVDKESSHPFIVQGEEDCRLCNGTGEEVITCVGDDDDCEGGFRRTECHVCNGKGTISTNPGERKIVPMEDMDKDHIKIVNPDTTINNYHHKKNADIYDMMIDALNLWRLEQRQSGTAKIIDQERLYLFISKISNHIFDRVITDSIKDILGYRNIVTVKGIDAPAVIPFSIMKPTQYQVKSSYDLLNEYKEGVISGLPYYIRSKMSLDFINRQYSGNEVIRKKGRVIYEMDAVYCYTENEKRRALENGSITIKEVRKSAQIPFILNQIIASMGDDAFIIEPIQNIKKAVDVIFEQNYATFSATDNPFLGQGGAFDFEDGDNVTK